MATPGQLFKSDSTVYYNGVFIEDIAKSKIKSKPILNRQRTAIKYVEHEIEIEAIVTPDSYLDQVGDNTVSTTTDAPMYWVRKKLLESGGSFTYKDKGFGSDFRFIKAKSRIKRQTVDYGPFPTMLAYETLGSSKSARIVWSITVRTPECENASFKGLAEFWCTSKLSIGKNGYQTLTRTGYFEIMENGVGRLGTKASDIFREYMTSLVDNTSMSHHHLEQEYNFSPDDRECNFELTYVPIPSSNPYPVAVVNIECEHSIASKLMPGDPFQNAFATWTNSMDCTIELLPQVKKDYAWAIFAFIASDRINESVEVTIKRIKNKNVITKVRVPYVLSLSISESIYSHKVSFEITWVSMSDDFIDVFKNSGMFKPITGASWVEWVKIARLKAQNPTGSYYIADLGGTDAIVTPCNQNLYKKTPGDKIPPLEQYRPTIFKGSCPPEYASWVDYQNKFDITMEAGTVTHRRHKLQEKAPRRDIYEPGDKDNAGFVFRIPNAYNEDVKEKDYFHQDSGTDKFFVTMTGYSIRLGGPTTPPEIKSVGGKEVRIVSDKNMISDSIVSPNGKCPTHVTKWQITYEILGTPEGDMDKWRVSSGEPGVKAP